MTDFAIDIVLMLLAAYLAGCAGGCWLRRTLMRRRHARS